MSKTTTEQKSVQKVAAGLSASSEPAWLEHNAETEARLREQAEDGKLRRWREKKFVWLFVLLTFGLCAVWTVVFLSGRFSLADKELVTNLLRQIIYGLACFLAGKNIKLTS